MTPRLRNLLIGLGISVVIMIVDQVNQSSGSGSSKKPRKAKTQRTKKVIAESPAQQTNTPITASVASAPTTKRRSSRSTSQLVGWQRNPFNSVALSSEADVESGSTNSEKQQDIEKSILLKNLERYNVEIVAEFNNEKVVLIDNRRFRQGEYLNNDILIERIENDQITFRNGNTTVTRNVGN